MAGPTANEDHVGPAFVWGIQPLAAYRNSKSLPKDILK